MLGEVRNEIFPFIPILWGRNDRMVPKGVQHLPGACTLGPGGMGPPSCAAGSDVLVTWLEATHVTAVKYDCGARGSSTFVAGCNDAVANAGPQSFGDDLKAGLRKGVAPIVFKPEGAGAGAALVRARLKIDIQGSAA